MAKYRKKPVEIEAFRFGYDEMPSWFTDVNIDRVLKILGEHCLIENCEIETLEGTITATWGDYIIKGVQDEIYPCKPDIFEKTYEKIEWIDGEFD